MGDVIVILVAGATGNAGSAVVRALVDRGKQVRAVVRDERAPLPEGAEPAVGDLNRSDTLEPHLEGVTAAFLLSGYDGLAGTLAAMRRARVERVVLLSSSAAPSGDLTNAVARYHVLSERAVSESGLAWTFLQPNSFMTNTLQWVPQLRKGDVIRAPFAAVAVATIDPADIGAVAAVALTTGDHDGRSYRLSGPQALRPADRVAILADVLGRDTLLTAARADNSRVRVVFGLRADFSPHCTDHPDLFTVLNGGQVLVGAMSPQELRRAISQPAIDTGGTVEAGLLATLVAEAAGQPGTLPLVSHALLQTWHRRRGNTLTLTGYQAAGGIHGALAQTADEVYLGFDTAHQELTRQLLLRLTALGEGTEDTKRRIRRDEFDPTHPGYDTVLARLAQARLIILDAETIEITHEALIKAWPRLRDWLTEDRDGLRTHRQLTEPPPPGAPLTAIPVPSTAVPAWPSPTSGHNATTEPSPLANATSWIPAATPRAMNDAPPVAGSTSSAGSRPA